MNIAIVVWDLNIKGGTQRQALELAASLQTQGHTVDVFSYVYDQEKCYTELCGKLNIVTVLEELPATGNHSFLKKASTFSDLVTDSSVRKLCRLIDVKKYDVINLHDYQVFKASAYLNHRNIVWMMNDIAGVSSHGETKGLIPRVVESSLLALTKFKIRKVRRIVVLDNRNRALCNRYYRRDAVVVRSGVDLDLFKGIKLNKTGDTKIFTSGIFFPHRRFEDLVLAAKLLVNGGKKNFHLRINGSNVRNPQYFKEIESLVEKNQLHEFITITNGMGEKELLQTYADSHIFVFPNHEQTWGLSVFEAMLADCVSVVSKTSGAHEVLTDEENALLVPPKSPEAIAEKIRLLMDDSKRMQSLAKNGHNFVVKNLSWDKYADQMLENFE